MYSNVQVSNNRNFNFNTENNDVDTEEYLPHQ